MDMRGRPLWVDHFAEKVDHLGRPLRESGLPDKPSEVDHFAKWSPKWSTQVVYPPALCHKDLSAR